MFKKEHHFIQSSVLRSMCWVENSIKINIWHHTFMFIVQRMNRLIRWNFLRIYADDDSCYRNINVWRIYGVRLKLLKLQAKELKHLLFHMERCIPFLDILGDIKEHEYSARRRTYVFSAHRLCVTD